MWRKILPEGGVQRGTQVRQDNSFELEWETKGLGGVVCREGSVACGSRFHELFPFSFAHLRNDEHLWLVPYITYELSANILGLKSFAWTLKTSLIAPYVQLVAHSKEGAGAATHPLLVTPNLPKLKKFKILILKRKKWADACYIIRNLYPLQ